MSENQNNAPLAHLRHALEMGQQDCSKEVLRGNGKAKNEESGHPTKPGPIGNASAPPLTIWQRQIEHLKERVSGLVRAENRAKEQRLLWHGKHAIVATENNALRKRLAKMTVELHRLQRHVEELSAYRAGRASGGESGPFNAYLDGPQPAGACWARGSNGIC